MNKFQKIDDVQIKKNNMLNIKDGTATAVMIEKGRSENEYPDNDKGVPDFD